MTRELGIIAGLAVAWGACTLLVVAGLITAPLVLGALAVVLIPALWAAGVARAASAGAPVAGGPTPPPARAA